MEDVYRVVSPALAALAEQLAVLSPAASSPANSPLL